MSSQTRPSSEAQGGHQGTAGASAARFPLIEVAGGAHAMGYQHGSQAAPLVRRHIAWIEELTGLSRDELARRAQAFTPYVRSASPLLEAEIEGLAEGAGISFSEAMLCQARGDAARIGSGGCTTFAVRGSATANGELLAGQNLDLEPGYEDVAILLRVRPDDDRPSALMLTFAGQVGYVGMNAHGVALFNNSLFDFDWQLALPRQPLKRLILEQRNVSAAAKLVRCRRVSSAANVLLCDGTGEMANIEIRPEGTAVLEGDHADCAVHTNHYVTRAFARHETDSLQDSRPRLARMTELIGRNWGEITAETMKGLLADHRLGDEENSRAAICRHGAAGWHSIAGLIAEPTEGRLYIRRGYGCSGTWTTYNV